MTCTAASNPIRPQGHRQTHTPTGAGTPPGAAPPPAYGRTRATLGAGASRLGASGHGGRAHPTTTNPTRHGTGRPRARAGGPPQRGEADRGGRGGTSHQHRGGARATSAGGPIKAPRAAYLPHGIFQSNGLDAHAHGTHRLSTAHTPPTSEGPNTSPHHSGLANETRQRPAGPPGKAPSTPTSPHAGRVGAARTIPHKPGKPALAPATAGRNATPRQKRTNGTRERYRAQGAGRYGRARQPHDNNRSARP